MNTIIHKQDVVLTRSTSVIQLSALHTVSARMRFPLQHVKHLQVMSLCALTDIGIFDVLTDAQMPALCISFN